VLLCCTSCCIASCSRDTSEQASKEGRIEKIQGHAPIEPALLLKARHHPAMVPPNAERERKRDRVGHACG
jgi:hypothetical protein